MIQRKQTKRRWKAKKRGKLHKPPPSSTKRSILFGFFGLRSLCSFGFENVNGDDWNLDTSESQDGGMRLQKSSGKSYKRRNPRSDDAEQERDKIFTFRYLYLAKSAELVQHLDDKAQIIRSLIADADIRAEDLQRLCGLDKAGQRRSGVDGLPPLCNSECLPRGWVGTETGEDEDIPLHLRDGSLWNAAVEKHEQEAEKLEKRATQIQAALHKLDASRRIMRAVLDLYSHRPPGWAEEDYQRLPLKEGSLYPGFGVIYQTNPDVPCWQEPYGSYLSSAPYCPLSSCTLSPSNDSGCYFEDSTEDQLWKDIWAFIQEFDGASIDEPVFRREAFRGDLGTWQRFLRYWRGIEYAANASSVSMSWKEYKKMEYHLRQNKITSPKNVTGASSQGEQQHKTSSREDRKGEFLSRRSSCNMSDWFESQHHASSATDRNGQRPWSSSLWDRLRQGGLRGLLTLLTRGRWPAPPTPPVRMPPVATQLLELMEVMLDINEHHQFHGIKTWDIKYFENFIMLGVRGGFAHANALAANRTRLWPLWFLEEIVHNTSDVFDTGGHAAMGLLEPVERESAEKREKFWKGFRETFESLLGEAIFDDLMNGKDNLSKVKHERGKTGRKKCHGRKRRLQIWATTVSDV